MRDNTNVQQSHVALRQGPGPSSSSSSPPLLLNPLSHFHSWMLNCPFLLSFISQFPERASLFLICRRWDSGLWFQSPASTKETPRRTKVESCCLPRPREMLGATIPPQGTRSAFP